MSLQVVVTGRGPDLVLLHGWGVAATVWRATAEKLSARFRVHSVDLPGYGGSPASVPYTSAQVVAELSATLPPAIVCGWSLGGQLALAWALHAPQQVQCLILVATTPIFIQRADWPHGQNAILLSQVAQGVTAHPAAFLAQFAALIAQGDTNARTVIRQISAVLSTAPLPPTEVLLAGLQWLRETDLRKQLADVHQPALVIHGDQDTITPLGAGTTLAAALPHARLSVQHGIAHAPFLSDPDTFTRQVMEFIDV
jgi:pimeloyl-[acyl-carrier protein] methyl ester esterase